MLQIRAYFTSRIKANSYIPSSLLDTTAEPKNSKFRNQIGAYNSIFQFTILGANVDNSINMGLGPYVFKLSGQNYHKIGSLLPPVCQGQNSLSCIYIILRVKYLTGCLLEKIVMGVLFIILG